MKNVIAAKIQKFFPKFVSIGLLSISIYLVFRIYFLDYVQTFDGHVYTHELLSAIKQPFAVKNFNIAKHIAFAYGLFLGISQYISFANTYLLNIFMAVPALLAIFAFAQILKETNPNLTTTDLTFANLVLVLTPLFLVSSFSLNLDFPLTCFYMTTLYTLIKRHVLLLAFSGFMLVFTKEPAILLYGTTLASGWGLHLLYHLLKPKKSLISKINQAFLTLPYAFSGNEPENPSPQNQLKIKALNTLLASLFPLFCIALYFFKHKTMWGHDTVSSSTNLQNLWNAFAISRLYQTFFLNFQWLLWFLMLAGLAFLPVTFRKGKSPDENAIKSRGIPLWLILIPPFLAYLLLHMIFTTWSNARYVLVLHILSLLFFIIYASSVLKEKLRYIIYGVVLSMFTLQCFYTLDPVSHQIFGSASVGNRKMLTIGGTASRLTHEGLGYAGRDQLMYNLEYLSFHYLIDKMYQTTPEVLQKPLIINQHIEYGRNSLLRPVNPQTKRHALWHNLEDFWNYPQIVRTVDIEKQKQELPKLFALGGFWLHFPFISHSTEDIAFIEPYFNFSFYKQIEYKGVVVDIYKVSLKE